MFNGMNPGQMMQMLQSPDKIRGLVMDSGAAAIVADVVNLHRLDNARIARELGVDLDINQMSEERAAELVSGLVVDEDPEIVRVFNELEDQREALLEELTDGETVESWRESKDNALLSE